MSQENTANTDKDQPYPRNAGNWPSDPNGAPREDDRSPEADERRRQLEADRLSEGTQPEGIIDGTDEDVATNINGPA